jgi:(p)ppGpp synthase/HD superfamily hydrolase
MHRVHDIGVAGAYTPAMERAVRTAIHYHWWQRRKCGNVPYLSHLVHVALIVQKHGFPEHAVIAALLHDAIEDTRYTAEKMRADFGDTVSAIVLELTEDKRLRWEARKAAYLDGIRRASPEARAVCCADKIHNLCTIMTEHAEHGEAVWRAFSRGKAQTLRFYRDALGAIAEGFAHPIVDDYRAVLARADAVFGGHGAGDGCPSGGRA